MNTVKVYSTENSFSVNRIVGLARFYGPCLKIGLILSALVPMVLYFMGAGLSSLTAATAYRFVIWPINFMILLSPLLLAWHDYRDVSAQLPVTAAEKLAFIFLTFVVVIPLLIYASGCVGDYLGEMIFGVSKDVMNDVAAELQSKLEISDITPLLQKFERVSVICNLCTVVIVAYYVVASKKNRILSGILSCIITNIAIGFLTIVFSMYTVIKTINSAVDGATELSFETLIIKIVIIMTTVITVAAIVYTVKLYKHLRNSGF